MALDHQPTQTEIVKKPVEHTWWKESTVYQIYPASFKDSNGDGWGDIPGIISKLDYIKTLGSDIVWLSPILTSPQVDMGYDISNYRDIDPQYGTMADHDALIKGLHDRGMKYVLDLVVNHSSDQHAWFKQSRMSKDNPYRDWYIWRPARYDSNGNRGPPNNWEAAFSGSVWEWDEHTQEYYLHLFAKEQPDLNWENPKVVEAVHDIVRFWLDRGVDGFRMDVINFISKEPGLPDAKIIKPGFLQPGIEHFACGPRLHEYLQGIGKILKEYDAFSVGEMPGVTDTKEILKAVGQGRGELGMVFQFEIVDLDHAETKWTPRKFSIPEFKGVVNKWQKFMLDNSGWNAVYMENHDQGRTVSRYCSDDPKYRSISSKMLASHLGFQSGTVFVFQGQELAQSNVPRDWGIEKYKDLEVINHWKEVLRDHPDDKELQEQTLKQFWLIGRDNARTPMQWTSEKYAGFLPSDAPDGAKPWMDIHPDYTTWNAENATKDPESSYHYWRKVLAIRKKEKDVFVYGQFEMIDIDHEEIVAYTRTSDEGKTAFVITNFAEKEIWWELPVAQSKLLFNEQGQLVTSNMLSEFKNYKDVNQVKSKDGAHSILIRPYESIVALV